LPNIKSAKKSLRQNAKRRARNRWRKSQISDSIKEFETALAGGKKKKINEALLACYSKLDTAAAKGTIHKNTAARKKARLTAQVNRAAK